MSIIWPESRHASTTYTDGMFVQFDVDAARATVCLIFGAPQTRIGARLQLILMPVLHHELLLGA